jgi:hypothetical protein
VPFELLRRHVLERAEDQAFLREVGADLRRRRGQPRGRVLVERRDRLRETEVEELHARPRQHDVPGFQVPVHDAVPVRAVERVRDLDTVAEDLVDRQRPLDEPMGQRHSFEQLHNEVIGLALAADVVESADVRVREL